MSNSKFRVALVRTFSQSEYKEPAEPLGIEALAAELMHRGIDCCLFDRELHSLESESKSILDYDPSLVGLSVMMEDNAPDAMRLLLRLRRQKPTLKFVVGGLFVTASFPQARAFFPADCELVSGEGEIPLTKICFEMMKKEVPETPSQYLNPPQWQWLHRPNLRDYLHIGAPINMRSSRGCPGKCKFCATPHLPGDLGKWRGRPIADVADEMEVLCSKYEPHAFNFVDDDFGPLSRVEELTRELAERGLRCALSLQLRASTLLSAQDLPQVMARLKAGGLCRVFIGLESFDADTLRYFNKPLEPLKAINAFKAVRDSGVAIHIGYILWHLRSTMDSVRKEAKQLRDSGFFTTKIVMSRLQLFPGCGLQMEREEKTPWKLPLDEEFNSISQAIAPLYDAWLIGAIDVPRQYCLSFLEGGNGAAAKKVRLIEEQLGKLDELAYAAIMDLNSASPETVQRASYEAKENFREIGCAFDSSRRS
ncbi:MAG: radical SAM protein [Clostridiales bacterium]|nr:radical SAM protein [Clostridiales bacterium]